MKHRKTKIVCTLGPASSSPEIIAQLIRAGMNIARINFSHGTHQQHAKVIKNIRAAAKQLDTHIAILQDLSGPKIRLGKFKNGQVQLTAGAKFVLTAEQLEGNEKICSINYPELIGSVKIGSKILLGDGIVELNIINTTASEIQTEVMIPGYVSSNQGITAPDADIPDTVPTEKDLKDLQFGLENQVDIVALSFVRNSSEVKHLRSSISEYAPQTAIVAKIEKKQALDDLDNIIDVSDGIMVARGDLGLELGLKDIPFAQKEIIRRSGLAGKPEITATQMLESMINSPRPTRAEVSDIANAIFDGTDAVMLSGETAVGNYPVQACKTMAEIAVAAESKIKYEDHFHNQKLSSNQKFPEAIAHAACRAAMETSAAAILCCTISGYTAQLMAKYRPAAPIIVLSPNKSALNRSLLLWGSQPVELPMADDTDQMIRLAKQTILQKNICSTGDTVIIVAGIPLNTPHITNFIKADVL